MNGARRLCDRRSSSTPKKDAAAFKMPLARRSSGFSRFKQVSTASSVFGPTPRQASISARSTHLRTDSGVGPQFLSSRTNRFPLRPVLVPMLEHHPHRTFTQLARISPMSWHDPILLKDGSLHQTPGRFSSANPCRCKAPNPQAHPQRALAQGVRPYPDGS